MARSIEHQPGGLAPALAAAAAAAIARAGRAAISSARAGEQIYLTSD